MKTVKIVGVPEHFNLPWHLCIENGEFEAENIDLQWKNIPEGTGKMCQMLRDGEADIAVILTEGIVKDIVAGNFGTNSQIKVSHKEPGELYFADFDNNGSIDPFFNFYVQGKSYPFVSRDELNDQIYPMRKKFAFYKDYANAGMAEIFAPEVLSKAGKLTFNEARSVCFMNRNGKFEKQILPVQAQFAPVTSITYHDFDNDGKKDLILLGNKSDNRLKLGSMDANYGCYLKGDGKGHFEYISQPRSGLSVLGDVKSVIQIKIKKEPYLVIGAFNKPLQFYQSEKK